MGKGDGLIHGAILHCQQTCQNLGRAGRIILFVDIFRIEDSVCIHLHQDGRFRADGRALWPVFNRVGLDRKRLVLLHLLHIVFRSV